MICLHCGNEFESKRADAKYCGDTCRKAFKRSVRDNPVRDNVRDKLSVTEAVWPHTRHLTPDAAAAWFKTHKPEWCNTARPGDPDYPQECYGGICQTCGAETEIKSITKCRKCAA